MVSDLGKTTYQTATILPYEHQNNTFYANQFFNERGSARIQI
jgi:hypothetical protein